ncbi:MAG: hypothetical protein HY231_06590 [Acidobacteria bacterium]|nr:hypothetical protein [Acidobacteriota bacterium]
MERGMIPLEQLRESNFYQMILEEGEKIGEKIGEKKGEKIGEKIGKKKANSTLRRRRC